MKSDKLENYIKISWRKEINPSRNLWADIRLDSDEAPKEEKNTVIWLAAASVILLCSVAGIFIFKMTDKIGTLLLQSRLSL